MKLSRKFLWIIIVTIILFFVMPSYSMGNDTTEVGFTPVIINHLNITNEIFNLSRTLSEQTANGLQLIHYNDTISYEDELNLLIEKILKNEEFIEIYVFEISEVFYQNEDNPLINQVILDLLPKLNQEIYSRYRTNIPTYLEGYGYTDPDYFYRYGRELGIETVQEFWKTQSRFIETINTYEFYIRSELITTIQQNSGLSGNIEEFKVTGEAKYEINGKLESFSKVEMKVTERIETRTLRLYETRRVEVELLRAPKGYFSWLFNGMKFKFEVIGSVYTYQERFANTEIILEPEILFNIRDRVY